MTMTLDLAPESVSRLREEAERRGMQAPDYARILIERGLGGPGVVTEAEREASNARLRAAVVWLDAPTGVDNESIDADLAREYADDHAPGSDR